MFRPHLYGASLELDLRCTSGLSARVTNPDNPHKILEHHHQEVARLRSAGSLIRAGISQLAILISFHDMFYLNISILVLCGEMAH